MKISRAHIGTAIVLILSMGAAMWVVWEIGMYPMNDHCPNSDLACASPNLMNVIPAGAGAIVGTAVMMSGVYLFRWLGWLPAPNAE